MRRYLSQIGVERYGALAERSLGPLAPGLNVVLGANEAGKSTIASLVGGVLFGWEEGRGVNNTYRPADGPRSGSLAFSAYGDAAERVIVRRDEDGAENVELVTADIDRTTWRAVFSLTSDELRTLRDSSDVTARLLTAGSGTGASPASAFVEIEQRIAAHTSRAEHAHDSVLRLDELLEEKRAEVKAAAEQVELWKQEQRELAELESSRAIAAERAAALTRQASDLAAWRAEAEALDGQEARCEAEIEQMRREMGSLDATGALEASPAAATRVDALLAGGGAQYDARLLTLDAAEERIVRDRLDELADEQDKHRRLLDRAKENSAASTAAYEALMELDEGASARATSSKTLRAALSLSLPLAFIAAGVPLFVHGRQIASLSFTIMGLGLLVVAFFLAVAAFVVLFRPERDDDALEKRRQDAQWVMLQDKKKLASSTSDMEQFDGRLRAYLDAVGLSAADGSVRQARSLLDGARERRALIATNEQRLAAIELRMRDAEGELAKVHEARRRLEEAAGLPQGAKVRDYDALLHERAEQRDALQEAVRNMNRQAGELAQRLEQARTDHALDRLKLEYQQIRTRLRESKHELVSLLLAKRLLERSITAWESQGQPEVYAQAGRLFSTITQGAWSAIGVSGAGGLIAFDANGAQHEVRHLSLGTCQQLYLALRIALLTTAEAVGRSVPVLADDILVNFDASRRAGAALALAELAGKRQVIVFTCHEETVSALREAAPDLNLLELHNRAGRFGS